MAARARSALFLVALAVFTSLLADLQPAWPAQTSNASSGTNQIGGVGTGPIEITADQIEYLQNTDVYEATGSVVIVQGPVRLTADRVTIFMLSGTLVATGHAHLSDRTTDIHAERIELDINTEAGVLTNGALFVKTSNALITGRLFQRLSEDHYRVKDGSYTTCDAGEGFVPAWRFLFKDADLDMGERIYGDNIWLCVLDHRILPLPKLYYPLETTRKTGFLMPTVSSNSAFGLLYQQSFFWALTRSQDMTITPTYYSKRGYGSDLAYRYILDRNSRGQWLMNAFQDTVVHRLRGQISGSHIQQVTPTFSISGQVNLLSDRTVYSNLSTSGVLRALPSNESDLFLTQRFTNSKLYLWGDYLQPLAVGGLGTFQRLPEIGYTMANFSPFGGPLLLGGDTSVVNWTRSQGFGFNRVDFMPGLSTDVLQAGHMIGLAPQVKFREVYYTRGVSTQQSVHRETFWAGLQATTRLSRQFRGAGGGSLLHTIEPNVFYEFVPASNQSNIIQVDAVDNLPKKNLVTYSFRSRLLELLPGGSTFNWLNLLVAQSYHVGAPQTQALFFPFPGDPLFFANTQQLQPTTVAVQGRKFSDIFARAVFGNTVGITPNALSLTVDSFFDPYAEAFSQFNTDVRYQREDEWYVSIGQRHTRAGNRVRRGDIWNPLSFGEVFAPTPELNFLTASAAIRVPLGWTVGARTYYDVQNGTRPETDIVAMYQNPCRCWSIGFYYTVLQGESVSGGVVSSVPSQTQFSFMLSLTGIGATQSLGTYVARSILSPLLVNERGLPWASSPAQQAAVMGPVPPWQPPWQ